MQFSRQHSVNFHTLLVANHRHCFYSRFVFRQICLRSGHVTDHVELIRDVYQGASESDKSVLQRVSAFCFHERPDCRSDLSTRTVQSV